MCFLTIDYESGNFWVGIAVLFVSVASLVAAIVALVLAKASVRLAESSLTQAQQVAEHELRDWKQRKWFDLYDAAESFITLLERFQVTNEN
jgi:hypothetical protein